MNSKSIDGAFEFVADLRKVQRDNQFTIHIPEGLLSKAALLTSFAASARFPSYFGDNWDALFDCLCDFEWIPENEIVISHRDLPLHNNPADCRKYLQILRNAISDWSRELATVNQPAHKLRAIFPASLQNAVVSMEKAGRNEKKVASKTLK